MSSAEFSSAKMAYQNKNYEKALTSLNKELANNPTNEEAYILKAEILYQLGRLPESAETASLAQKKIKTPELQQKIAALSFNLWVAAYNQGNVYLNEFYRSTNKIYVDSALMYYDAGIKLRPEIADFYDLKGRAYEAINDTNKAIQQYNMFVDAIAQEIALAKEKEVYLQISRDEFIRKVGKPIATNGGSLPNKDSILTDQFKVDGKEVITTSLSKNGGEFKINAWRVNPPDYWHPQEKVQGISLTVDPIAALAQINYERKEYRKALDHINTLLTLAPDNTQASASVVAIYTEMGKLDEALESLDKLTKENPRNKFYWGQFGDVYSNLADDKNPKENYKKAIEKYKKALEIDPSFDLVLRNLASAYKNLASVIQIEQQDKMDKDPKYEPNTKEYVPYLENSAKYFAESLETNTFKNDFRVLGELSNIYTVLEDEQKLRNVLLKLESLEMDIKPRNKEQYYLILLRIYSDLKESDKMKVVQKKIENL